MRLLERSRARGERIAYLYACALTTAYFLFLPWGGYERMMEGKIFCFLALTLGFLAAMACCAPWKAPRMTPGKQCAAAYLACSALSAVCSPYGAETLLGGSRREGLVVLALYVLSFFCLARFLHADRRLLYLALYAALLCAALALAQIAGANPLGLYPDGLGWRDGDVAYAGFFAGTAGNADFTAFLLALFTAVGAAAAIRLRLWALAPAIAAALWALARLDVANAWAGLAFAALWSPALLAPKRRRAMLPLSLLLTCAVLLWLRAYDGGSAALRDAARLLHGELDPDFASSRLAIWRDCLPLVRERPLLGGGPDTLGLRGLEPFTWYRDGRAIPSDVTAAHNEYLNILVNQGVFALAAYLGLLGCSLARCLRKADEPRFALCGVGLLCYAAMAAFSISTCITAPFVWLLLALAQGEDGENV